MHHPIIYLMKKINLIHKLQLQNQYQHYTKSSILLKKRFHNIKTYSIHILKLQVLFSSKTHIHSNHLQTIETKQQWF